MTWDVEVLTTWRRPGDPHVAARFAGPGSWERALECLAAELEAIRKEGGSPVVECRRWVAPDERMPDGGRRGAGVAVVIEILRKPLENDAPGPGSEAGTGRKP